MTVLYSTMSPSHAAHLKLSAALLLWLSTCCKASNVVRFGSPATLTGIDSDVMRPAGVGVQLWQNKTNALNNNKGFNITDSRGQTFYFKVQATILDDGFDTDTHVANLDALLHGPTAAHFLICGHPFFRYLDAVASQSARRLSLAASGDTSLIPYNFRYALDLTSKAPSTQTLILKTAAFYGYNRVGLLVDTSFPFSNSVCSGAWEIMNSTLIMMQVVVRVEYASPINQTTLETIFHRAKEERVEMLIVCGLFPDVAEVTIALPQFKTTFPIISTTIVTSFQPGWRMTTGTWGNYVMSYAAWHPKVPWQDELWGLAINFDTAFRETLGTNIPPGFLTSPMAASAATSGYVFVEALRQAFRDCELDPVLAQDIDQLLFNPDSMTCRDNTTVGYDRILEWMYNMKGIETMFGSVKFSPEGLNVGKQGLITQVQDLTTEIVLPLDLATKLPIIPAPNPFLPTCQPGTYMSSDQFFDYCKPCPDNYHSAKQNATLADCLPCARDKMECLKGSYTPRSRYWHSHPRSLNIAFCILPAGCQRSDISALVAWQVQHRHIPSDQLNASDYLPLQCQPGYEGNLCSVCSQGYALASQECRKCPRKWQVALSYAGLLLALLLLIAVSINSTIATSEMIQRGAAAPENASLLVGELVDIVQQRTQKQESLELLANKDGTQQEEGRMRLIPTMSELSKSCSTRDSQAATLLEGPLAAQGSLPARQQHPGPTPNPDNNVQLKDAAREGSDAGHHHHGELIPAGSPRGPRDPAAVQLSESGGMSTLLTKAVASAASVGEESSRLIHIAGGLPARASGPLENAPTAGAQHASAEVIAADGDMMIAGLAPVNVADNDADSGRPDLAHLLDTAVSSVAQAQPSFDAQARLPPLSGYTRSDSTRVSSSFQVRRSQPLRSLHDGEQSVPNSSLGTPSSLAGMVGHADAEQPPNQSVNFAIGIAPNTVIAPGRSHVQAVNTPEVGLLGGVAGQHSYNTVAGQHDDDDDDDATGRHGNTAIGRHWDTAGPAAGSNEVTVVAAVSESRFSIKFRSSDSHHHGSGAVPADCPQHGVEWLEGRPNKIMDRPVTLDGAVSTVHDDQHQGFHGENLRSKSGWGSMLGWLGTAGYCAPGQQGKDSEERRKQAVTHLLQIVQRWCERVEAETEASLANGVLIKMIISYTQLCGMIGSIIPDEYGLTALVTFSRRFNFTNPLGEIRSISCLIPGLAKRPQAKLMLDALLPTGCCASILFLFWFFAAPMKLASHSYLDMWRQYLGPRLLMTTILVLYDFYPAIIKQVLSIFHCVAIDRRPPPPGLGATAVGSYWVSYPNTKCYQGDHQKLATAFGIPFVIVFSVGFPLCCGAAAYALKKRDLLRNQIVQLSMGFYINGFRPQYCWWETVVLLEKLVLMGLISLRGGFSWSASEEKAVPAILGECQAVMTLVLIAKLWCQPYVLSFHNQLDILSSALPLLQLQLSLIVVSTDNAFAAMIVSLTVISAYVMVTCFTGLVFVVTNLQKFKAAKNAVLAWFARRRRVHADA